MWVWQQNNWPHFHWDQAIIEPMVRQTRLNQGILLGKITCQSPNQQQSMLDTLLANIVHSSAIEGEKLNAFSVRSSLANKLGMTEEKPFPTTEQTDGDVVSSSQTSKQLAEEITTVVDIDLSNIQIVRDY